ncbi:hypothetical protein [Leptospira broomii]|uniref:hypothetical protein n=1 Tax=Leptospira broomii TaxID=301541 RepID=UPI0012EC95D5|nr:hypothetical protein [Leptospira broomii]
MVKLLKVLYKPVHIFNMPGRWAEVIQTAESKTFRRWIFNTNLVTKQEAANLYLPVIKKQIESSVGSFIVPEIYDSSLNYTVFSLSPTENFTCNSYSDSSCINLIFHDGKLIYSDNKGKEFNLLILNLLFLIASAPISFSAHLFFLSIDPDKALKVSSFEKENKSSIPGLIQSSYLFS